MAKKLLWAVPIIFIGVLFYWPLATILGRGFNQEWLHDIVDPKTLDVLWFTFWQAAVSTVLCLILGIPGAYVLYRRRFKGQKVVRALITVPFMLPTVVVATAFSAFHKWNTSSAIWIIVAHVFINYSLAVRTIGSQWSELDESTEEAAELAGAGRLRSFWSVMLPQLRGSFIASAATIFLYCATSYGIILMVGGGLIHSLETDIANAAIGMLDLPRTSALALIQTLLSVVAFTFSLRGSQSDIDFDGAGDGVKRSRLDKRDAPAAALTTLIVVVLLVAPMVSIFWRALDSSKGAFFNFTQFDSHGYRELLNVSVMHATANSLRNMLVSACISLVIGVLIAWLMGRSKTSRSSRLLDLLLLLPLGISTVVLGLGYLVTFSNPLFPLRESWLAVPLIQSVIAVPLVIRIVRPAIAGINAAQLEAAATEGASRWKTWQLIELPLIRKSVVTAAAFACLISIGEFGAASLLAFGDQATLPTVLYALISRPGGDNYGMAMAISSLLMLFTFAIVLVVSLENPRLGRRRRNAYA
ncbi:MAG: iron ABC transporter permease [Rhodoluna sp.]|nr:iron ABC transporter permease [Rhodoluna sp.]